MGRTLFDVGTVVTAGGSYGTGVLVEDEKVATAVGRSFAATEGLEVRV